MQDADRPIELWGGIEATVNRVRDNYFSQLDRNGHHTRDDVQRLSDLGIRAIRYPILWERVAPAAADQPKWSWVDERVVRLRDAGVRIIAGLIHHGSGPRYTSLIDPQFPELFARYARMVAERYPWLQAYTPVNEPLTTARFSGLYGIWYPHGRDQRTFKTALLNQCRAIVLAMREISRVNPAAHLIQTEDLGKTFSTQVLAYQARFNNELRWLTWDLLSGRVEPGHRLWKWLTRRCGATASELMWFADNPCPPDVIGVNHYITSERFLDEHVANYPARYHGGNKRHRYADIEAARSLATPTGGIQPLLRETWERYRRPIAITEVHIDSTRDDQMRWVTEIWQAAHAARDAGIDMRAVTAWALFGTFDWHCLLSQDCGYYEPGAFDIRGPAPRETAVGKLWRGLARGETPTHPVLADRGWWHRADRFFCQPVQAVQSVGTRSLQTSEAAARPLLITGATGTLGRAFARICSRRGLSHLLLPRQRLDIADLASVTAAVERYRPWAIINAAGYVRVDDAEFDIERCFRENTQGPQMLASVCARAGLP
ncbi:MAG TPA: family 1 glycosylhydrolase, partial [Burkholderiales bacterium]|nr:family 1 glycosylhydrolase [Burkholderiales bacterium]